MNLEGLVSIDPDNLPRGTTLAGGRLTLTHRIARGGMSTVYAADTSDGKTLAIKIIASKYADDPIICERFRNEARLAQAVADHPRVVVPYEVGEAVELGHRLYMTMPLVLGTPLSVVPMGQPWRRWTAVVADLARTVGGLHERGIIHRDIKPSNVIVSTKNGDDVPYLLDFGFAYSTGKEHVPATAGLTQVHECPGTKFYMAPEQALGRTPAPSFDVYALALTLYELLAGMHPLDGMTTTEAIQRKCDRALPSLSILDHRRDLPDALVNAIDCALEREPKRRTASAVAFAQQLEGVLRMTQGPAEVVSANMSSNRYAEILEARHADTEPDGGGAATTPPPSGPRHPVQAERMVAIRRGLLGLLVVSISVVAWFAFRDCGGAVQDFPAEVIPAALAGGAASGEVTEQATGGTTEHVLALAEDSGSGDSSGATTGPESTADPDVGDETTTGAEAPQPKVRPSQPNPASVACKARREAADEAAARGDWNAVLDATARSRCWPRGGSRRARVQALHRLGKYRECIKAAKNATDTPTQRNARLCELALANDPAAQ